MKRDVMLYLKDILDALESAETFVRGLSYNQFVRDDKTVSAVIRKLEIVGEAARQIPEDLRAKHPEVPWRQMAEMRNRLIHAYFKVHYPLVWSTIRDRIPQLKPLIARVLADMKDTAGT
ncbi:MAG: DUF86 domain-containing protein [Planctomycetes bacterium]|nr:DUF86 domain-containing protein [Planctomycetota bacterium]MBM4082795.1 DUF86 domain-containing protein [Planctomycetota bacterium]